MAVEAGLVTFLALVASLGAAIVVFVWGAQLRPGTPRRFLVVGAVLLVLQGVLRPLWAVLGSLTYRLQDPATIAAVSNIFNVVVTLLGAIGILCLGWAAREAIRAQPSPPEGFLPPGTFPPPESFHQPEGFHQSEGFDQPEGFQQPGHDRTADAP